MSALLRVLAGAGGGWIAGGVALALLAAGAGGGYAARGLMDAPVIAGEKLKTAQCVAGREAARADAAQAAVTALNASAAQVSAALERLAAKAAARAKINDRFVTEIANAPATHACGASAAELAFRRSVQPVKEEK
ncbi:MAG: hypothetical protein V4601_13895 [Pseudomonadota bacterium]